LNRKVFGGGAVTPDILVEAPKITELETKIYQKGLFLTFAVDYTSKHELQQGFSVDEGMLSSFKSYLTKKEVEFTDEEFDKAREGIVIGIKRNICMKLWGMASSYEAVLLDDIQVTRALDILKDAKKTDDLFSTVE
jgi:carboxyl-terminal processing protease